jgi:hypothetical protein
MKRIRLLMMAAVTSMAVAVPAYVANAAGKSPQNYICHYGFDDADNDNVVDPGEGHYVLLKLSAKGAANHLLHHTDDATSGVLPDFTATADTDCNAV